MDDNDVLGDLLKTGKPADKKDELDVLKELFSIKDIETKTELSDQQIVLINQKRMIAKMLNWTSLDMALNDYMLLMVSRSRKGRAEFVDGFKANREANKQQSDPTMLQRLGGFISGGGK